MKKHAKVLGLAAIVAGALALTGCEKKDAPKTPEAPKPTTPEAPKPEAPATPEAPKTTTPDAPK